MCTTTLMYHPAMECWVMKLSKTENSFAQHQAYNGQYIDSIDIHTLIHKNMLYKLHSVDVVYLAKVKLFRQFTL